MTELISGSQLDAWSRCQRLYYYSHDRRIAPKETGWPLALGRAGHSVLAAYYAELATGRGHAAAMEEAEGLAAWRMDVLGQDPKALGYIMPMVRYHWAAHATDVAAWEIIEVEAEYRVPRAGWTYVATIDLIVRDRTTRQLVVVDHRFLTSFYTRAMARHDPQMARYALAVRQALGEPVTLVIRNMISTEPLAAAAKANRGRTKRIPVELTQRRIEIVAGEAERTAHEILAWRQLPMASRGQLARRTVIVGDRYPSCATCEFVKLCQAEAWGEDTTQLEAAEYGPSDYGTWE